MEELAHIPDLTERVDRLCELNVLRQVFNVASSPVVQGAWDRGTPLAVHGFVYSVETGLIKVGEVGGVVVCVYMVVVCKYMVVVQLGRHNR